MVRLAGARGRRSCGSGGTSCCRSGSGEEEVDARATPGNAAMAAVVDAAAMVDESEEEAEVSANVEAGEERRLRR